ncbi:MAG: right-handed parallel beta-helix repeat-containing protein [Thermoplasmata archaeon]|nr:MAG: right-handed parallel beta-helix repeat-containing protein [Thermoplasmata archaeon]
MKKISPTLLCLVIFTAVFAAAVSMNGSTSPTEVWVDDDFGPSTPGWGVDHFDKVQDGVNAVAVGGTVTVYAGTYNENVLVDRTMNLEGESTDTTVVDGGGSGDVVRVTADWVEISGFAMINSGDFPSIGGIVLDHVQHCIIIDNHVSNNNNGVYLSGSHRNTLHNNIMESNSGEGIELVASTNNTLSNNSISNNTYGIIIFDSECNLITENSISVHSYGIFLDASYFNLISSNSISDYDDGITFRGGSYNNTIYNNSISNGRTGITFRMYCGDNTIFNNCISNNFWGIHLKVLSHSTTISYNTISRNEYGINLNGGWNTIYHNSIIDNTYQASDDMPDINDWHHLDLLEGNYWSDYPGEDVGGMTYPWDATGKHLIAGDGIGDTSVPHPATDYDYYPLMNRIGCKMKTIEAAIDIDPDTLNLKSKGRWISCYVELPDEHEVSEIDIGTVLLEDAIPAEWGNVQGDMLMVKFDRGEVQDVLSPGTYSLKVAGELTDGILFEGYSDDIRVIDPP